MSNDGYDVLGFLSLALLYLTLGIGCLFATAIMVRIGVKQCMIVGSLCDFFWICINIIPALAEENPDSDFFMFSTGFIYFINVLASVLDGFGDAV
jgi:hypothetical protein